MGIRKNVHVNWKWRGRKGVGKLEMLGRPTSTGHRGLQGGYGLEFPAAAAQKVGWLWASPKAERGAGTLLESPREDSATRAKAVLTEVGRQTRVGEGFGRKTCQGEEGCRGRGRRVESRSGHPGSWHPYLCLVMVVRERGVGQVAGGR